MRRIARDADADRESQRAPAAAVERRLLDRSADALGDLFWGAGPDAEFLAGHMKSPGRLYILLPRSLTPTS